MRSGIAAPVAAGQSIPKGLLAKITDALNYVDPLVTSDENALRLALTRAGLALSPEIFRVIKIVSVILLALLGAVCAKLTGGKPLLLIAFSLVGGTVGWALPRIYLTVKQKNRLAKLEAQLPDAMELLSVALAAGSPIEQSFRVVAATIEEPLASELMLVDREVNLVGHSRDKALANLAKRCDSKQINLFAAQITQAINQGSSVSAGLQRQAKLARETQQAAIMERIRKMPVKLDVVLSFCFLPPTVALVTVPTVVNLLDFLGNTMS